MRPTPSLFQTQMDEKFYNLTKDVTDLDSEEIIDLFVILRHMIMKTDFDDTQKAELLSHLNSRS